MYFEKDPAKMLSEEAVWLRSTLSTGNLSTEETSVKNSTQNNQGKTLVFENEKGLIVDYLFLTMQQMERCVLSENDKIGCYRIRDLGFPGLAVRFH